MYGILGRESLNAILNPTSTKNSVADSSSRPCSCVCGTSKMAGDMSVIIQITLYLRSDPTRELFVNFKVVLLVE